MDKSYYVSYDVAKILQEKNFDGEHHMNYVLTDMVGFPVKEGDLTRQNYAINNAPNTIPAPSLHEAQKWLRKRGIFVSVFPIWSGSNGIIEYRARIVHYFDLIDNKKGKLMPFFSDTYESELNEGIREALKMILL